MKQLNDINLKQLRKSRGFTQEQLGIIAGMTKSQVSKMERGLLGSDVTISRVLSALGYSTKIICIDSRGELRTERERILDILRVFKINNADRYGIESLALFGSFARNEQKDDSDIVNDTGASTATISRVNRSLESGNEGYDLIFDRSKK